MIKWFKKWGEKSLDPIGFDFLKTDVHSHLIPGIDDGASTLKESIDIINAMVDLGYRKIITTPHIMSDCYQNSSETILAGLNNLRLEIDKQGIDISIEAAAEYYIDYDFEQKIKSEKLLTFGDNYILIETSFLQEPLNFKEIIFNLQVAGYKVVLAHPERYPFMTLEDYQELHSKSVFLQLNLLSLVGYYGIKVQLKAHEMIKQGLVSFVGSDCHNIHQISLYQKCQSTREWHDLVKLGGLLNKTL